MKKYSITIDELLDSLEESGIDSSKMVIEEPEKVKVPRWLANWFKPYEEDGPFSSLEVIFNDIDHDSTGGPVDPPQIRPGIKDWYQGLSEEEKEKVKKDKEKSRKFRKQIKEDFPAMNELKATLARMYYFNYEVKEDDK